MYTKKALPSHFSPASIQVCFSKDTMYYLAFTLPITLYKLHTSLLLTYLSNICLIWSQCCAKKKYFTPKGLATHVSASYFCNICSTSTAHQFNLHFSLLYIFWQATCYSRPWSSRILKNRLFNRQNLACPSYRWHEKNNRVPFSVAGIEYRRDDQGLISNFYNIKESHKIRLPFSQQS